MRCCPTTPNFARSIRRLVSTPADALARTDSVRIPVFILFANTALTAINSPASANPRRRSGEAQCRAGGQTRGAGGVGRLADALAEYTLYLKRRCGSYMQLEAQRDRSPPPRCRRRPFDPPHRLSSYGNLRNTARCVAARADRSWSTLPMAKRFLISRRRDVGRSSVRITPAGVEPQAVGPLPPAGAGTGVAVKEYERQTIEAAVQFSRRMASMALFLNRSLANGTPPRRSRASFSPPTLTWGT